MLGGDRRRGGRRRHTRRTMLPKLSRNTTAPLPGGVRERDRSVMSCQLHLMVTGERSWAGQQ
jgi:hypothetical protein